MITRACISLNNRCNLSCSYCHFHENHKAIKAAPMDVYKILDNIRLYLKDNAIPQFKIGFVGNGEPLLEFDELKKSLERIGDLLQTEAIAAYTITNGTLLDEEKAKFLLNNKVNIGISIDGPQEIHDKLRCASFDKVMQSIKLLYSLTGHYPSMNCTVGQMTLDRADETIHFFEQFHNRITFSRMIGQFGIPLSHFHAFLNKAEQRLNIRRGGYDCTMYGGLCGAGINNIFYANGQIFLCGNCIDIPSKFSYDTPLEQLDFAIPEFNRNYCYKELFLRK